MDWSVPATDPRQFNDPLALEVGWESISKEGSNILLHQLKQAGPGQLKYVMSGSAIQFCVGFMGLGLFFAGLSLFVLKSSLGLVMGVLFAVIGGVFYHLMNTPIIFDAASGFFWKGRGQPYQNVFGVKSPQVVIALNQIHALQLITKRVISRATTGMSGSNYLTYELNLVLKDKTRTNVVCQGNITSSKAEANALAKFLSVPLWDAAKTETECLPPEAPQWLRSISRAVDSRSEKGS